MDDKQIFLPTEVKKELMKDFKTNKVTLWNALTFKTNSSFANMLRKAALERGGVLYGDSKRKEGYTPTCDTDFNTAAHTMIQRFGERVKLIASTVSGSVQVFVDEELKVSYDIKTLEELGEIQTNVEALAGELSRQPYLQASGI
jgi:hypothetical protein